MPFENWIQGMNRCVGPASWDPKPVEPVQTDPQLSLFKDAPMPAITAPIQWLNWMNDLVKLNSFLVLEHKINEAAPTAPKVMQPVIADLNKALDTNKLDEVRIVLLKALGREDEAQSIREFVDRKTAANDSRK